MSDEFEEAMEASERVELKLRGLLAERDRLQRDLDAVRAVLRQAEGSLAWVDENWTSNKASRGAGLPMCRAALARVRAALAPAPPTPEPEEKMDTTALRYGVFLPGCTTPNQPAAVFEYADQAQAWGNEHYRGRFEVRELRNVGWLPPAEAEALKARVDEYKCEVERREEIIAGQDADLAELRRERDDWRKQAEEAGKLAMQYHDAREETLRERDELKADRDELKSHYDFEQQRAHEAEQRAERLRADLETARRESIERRHRAEATERQCAAMRRLLQAWLIFGRVSGVDGKRLVAESEAALASPVAEPAPKKDEIKTVTLPRSQLAQVREALRATHHEIERLSEWLRELGHPTQDKTCEALDDARAALAILEGVLK